MIYLFHGSDTDKVREKAFAWVAAARAKEPGLAYARIAKEDITESVLEDAAQSGGLFIKRLLVLFDDPFAKTKRKAVEDEEEDEEEEEDKDVFASALDMLAASDNAIVIVAPKLLAAKAKKIIARAAKDYAFDLPKAPPARGFNINLTNALAARDGEKLWLEIERALRQGDAPEMLHGLLHWKARDILAKGGGRAYPPRAARELSLKLISLLQDSRRTGSDLTLALERFALSL